MASITSLMNSSSTSSIYGTRNVISGLASGMDTEQMIENAVSGIKKKIQTLYQKRTKIEWQQEAFRSIIDKAVNLSTKYTSYSSKTNLLSNSFFTNSVITSANGTYASKVSASGKTSSDIKINAVKQLATAASYTVSGSAVFGGDSSTVTGRSSVDMVNKIDVSTVSGQLTLQYGGNNGTSFDLNFEELDVYDNAEDLAQAIRDQLSEQTFGDSKGSDLIKVEVDGNGNIKFSDATSNGNDVYISSAVGDIKDTLGVSYGSRGDDTLNVGGTSLSKKVQVSSNLSGKSLTLNLNGSSKTINMTNVLRNVNIVDEDVNDQFVNALQNEIDSAFGKGKIEVSLGEDGKMSFRTNEAGSTLVLSGTAAGVLGFENGDANYLNTSSTLKDLLGERSSYDFTINGVTISADGDTTLEGLMNSINSNADMGVKVSYSKLTNEFKFTATETGSGSKIEFSGLAKEIFNKPNGSVSDNFADAFGLGENDSKIITFHDPDGSASLSFDVSGKTMEDIVNDLNGMLFQSGVSDFTAFYDEQTGKFVAANRYTGESYDIKITSENEAGEDVELKPVNLNSTYTAGTDAVMDVEINGKRFENLTRTSNSFEIDGLTVNVKGTFGVDEDGNLLTEDKDGNEIEPITFTTVTDSDKLIDAIREFINDYNEMVTELKGAYSTQPNYDSSGDRYMPLTAEEEAEYTESQLASYNETAKQGILFGDTTLSSFYSKLLNAITPGGTDGQALREIGISTSYENGLTTLSLDEDKLRTALDNDLDKVKDVFTKTTESGSSSNGLMQNLQNTLNTYVKTTGEPKGALIVKAGSVKAPTSLSNNSLYNQITNIDKQIAKWQDKMSTQIDRYTTQFSRLEQLMASMESQYSALSSLMGGYSDY